MNKQKALQKIEVLEKELADLKKIVNAPEENRRGYRIVTQTN